MILHHSLTKTSACKISGDMFFNNDIKVTFKWCVNNFFLETLFSFFFLRIFSCQLDFSLSLGSWIFWQLSSCFRVLVVPYSLNACCECWLPCVNLSLHYKNIDNVYIWCKMHEKLKDKKENMEIT